MAFETFLTSYGFLFGRAFEMVLGEIKSIEKWVLAGILAIGVLVWFIHFRKMRRLRSTVDQPTVSLSEM